MFLRKNAWICFDPDPAGGGGGGAPAAPPVPASPAPPAVTPPPAPPVPVQPAAIPRQQVQDLPQDAMVEIDGARVRVADLVEHARTAPRMTAEQRKQFDLFQRLQNNDPEALLEVAGFNKPTPPAPVDPRDVQIKALQEQLQEVAAPVKEITAMREMGVLRKQIAGVAEHLPYLNHVLTKDPERIAEVHQAVAKFKDLAKSSGQNPNDPQVANRILTSVLGDAEERCRQMATVFGSTFKPPVAGGQPQVAVDAQGRPLPTQVPSPGIGGTTLSPSATHQPDGRFTRDDLLQRMRDSRQAGAGI